MVFFSVCLIELVGSVHVGETWFIGTSIYDLIVEELIKIHRIIQIVKVKTARHFISKVFPC